MTEAEAFQKVVDLLKDPKFNCAEGLRLETRIIDLPHWDSFKHLSFFMDLEEIFSIEFGAEDVGSIENINDIIKRAKSL